MSKQLATIIGQSVKDRDSTLAAILKLCAVQPHQYYAWKKGKSTARLSTADRVISSLRDSNGHAVEHAVHVASSEKTSDKFKALRIILDSNIATEDKEWFVSFLTK
jgi:hypothetical protein